MRFLTSCTPRSRRPLKSEARLPQPTQSLVLVTGGAGFIGSHLVETLVAQGRPVRVVDNFSTGHERNLAAVRNQIDLVRGDLRDPGLCQRAVEGVDVVFHLAALPSVPRSLLDPWASHDANVNATVRLLVASAKAGIRRVVYSSSSSVYGNSPELPRNEATDLMPRSPYAAAKLAAEQYVLAFARAGNFDAVALRYFNVFGPRQDPDSPYAAVIPAFLSAALHNGVVSVFGDGHQTRDFTYVQNVVCANLLASEVPAAKVNGLAMNVGAGKRTSLLDLLQMIEQLTGRTLTRRFGQRRSGDVRDSLASLKRASDALGYEPEVDLPEGLRLTWAWLRDGRRGPTDIRAAQGHPHAAVATL